MFVALSKMNKKKNSTALTFASINRVKLAYTTSMGVIECVPVYYHIDNRSSLLSHSYWSIEVV